MSLRIFLSHVYLNNNLADFIYIYILWYYIAIAVLPSHIKFYRDKLTWEKPYFLHHNELAFST